MNAPVKMNTVTGQPIHSRLGPSSAHRWMNCSGSVAVIAAHGLHEEDSGEPAARGTVCHNIAAECLMTGKEAWEFAGKKYKEGEYEFTVDEDMTPEIEKTVAFVRALLKKYEPLGAIMYVEAEVRSTYDPEAYGTADIRIEVPGVLLIVLDFKYGFVRVEPTDEQLKLYGYYSYEMRGERMRGKGEPKEIQLYVAQPYLPNPNDHFRDFKTTPEALSSWFFEEVLFKMEDTRDPNALLTTGDWCHFCPANRNAKCPAIYKEIEALPLNAPLGGLSNEQIGDLRKAKKRIVKFLAGVDAEALIRLRMGHKVPGAMLVNKTGHRVWHDKTLVEIDGKQITVKVEDLLAQQYGDKAYSKRELLSPAQIEELEGGKSLTARFAYKPDTGVTVADADDKREPVVGIMQRLDKQQAASQEVPV